MILGVSGKKRSGKDSFYTIAQQYFSEYHPEVTLHRVGFADEVKVYANLYFNVSQTDGADKEGHRFILQGIGQMFRSEVDQDYWVNIALNKLVSMDKKHKLAGTKFLGIITDVRYRNEATRIIEESGILIRVVNDRVTHNDTHPSETDLDGFEFDHIIHNNGTLEEYRERVITWLKEHVLI